jgi:hypothetical protein
MKSIGAGMIVLGGAAIYCAGALTRDKIGPADAGEMFGILIAFLGLLGWAVVSFRKSDDR